MNFGNNYRSFLMEQMRFRDRAEAQRVLDRFPHDTLKELVTLARVLKRDPTMVEVLASRAPTVVLPEGWAYQVFGNCILARCCDGEQEREAFWAPQIMIEFEYVPNVRTTKSLKYVHPLGHCSCGRPMRLAQLLLWSDDMVKSRGRLAKLAGYAAGGLVVLGLKLRPVEQLALQFNRHPACL